jgi:phosphatidylethanolamine/phosphatidyl-N-methylethanolamine N-methyltransferase
MCDKHQDITLNDIKKVYSAWTPLYDKTFGIVSEQGRKELAKIIFLLNSKSILEVGVGTGLMLPHYPISAEITGIDACERMLSIAKNRALILKHMSINLIHSDAEHLQYADASFDCVVAAYVLSVTPNPELLISEIRRVCKKNGSILIVNHFSGNKSWYVFEHLIKNLANKIGFRSEFSYQNYIQQHDWEIQTVKSVNMFGLSKLIVIKNV